MDYLDESTREGALWTYLKEEMMKSQGVSPSLRDIIRDKVGEKTKVGAITSTNIARRYIKKLEDIGLIETVDTRGVRIKGAIYMLPNNIWNGQQIQDYNLILGDERCWRIQGDFEYDWKVPLKDKVLTVKDFTGKGYIQGLIAGTATYFDIPLDETAVVTEDLWVKLVAVSMSVAVFEPEDVWTLR